MLGLAALIPVFVFPIVGGPVARGDGASPPDLDHRKRLCRSFMDRNPDGFERLLTEQLTVSSLLGSAA
jgi:hypothetical protein